ncbi:TIGR03986 family type III CRISPR-associated RAMP protein [Algoriphagus chordae]|uniref:CRISPR-associated protein (TIGR03986 family) n=1 Tax=Algoriphagus chordae TaxID=237019 RepID=A0A2W7QLW9_9BACT|nr:TIGR03986 family CRISPR-associated RAMP protein [Algoriphagus chordae]PZX48286.1 CRISPR-associated protein (TIGR03986 family) [Algoriphagus chordae]
MITAPYNFVPLNDKVVNPFWSEFVSHDKPFENAKSGTLQVKITAESPIFVRNGSKRKFKEVKAENEKIELEEIIDPEFNHLNGKYFIPGASIKGMIRNLIEIMSFGSMEDKVDDIRYSVRDFQNNSIYPKSDLSKESLCGWLRLVNGSYYLRSCGRPGRIKHMDLDKISGPRKISAHYQNRGNVSKPKQKTAKDKYDNFTFNKEGHRFRQEDEEDGIGRRKFVIDSAGVNTGTIVFSGQPGNRTEPNKGKQYEFIFFEKDTAEVELGTKEDSIITNFYHAYYDHDRNQQGDDWKWRKAQLLKGESIPVFFRLKNDEKPPTASNIKDMGLSLLYKITYKQSVRELIRNTQGEKLKKDFAETLFGYATKNEALKGRVNISHAFATGSPTVLPMVKEVLSGPKATYYPNYIAQNSADGKVSGYYKTMMDANAKIRGYKRYPVRSGDVTHNPAPINERTGKPNEGVTTQFKPLAKGTEFSFTVNYHNLREEELGALFSALTFHLNEGFYHSIGMGKPLGYGKVKLDLQDINQDEALSAVKNYEGFMNWALNNSTPSWHKSDEIKELFTMAKPHTQTDKDLKYMKMDMRNNEFVNAKGRKKQDPKFSLPTYSQLAGEIVINNHIDESDLYKYKAFFEQDEVKFRNLQTVNPKELYTQIITAEKNKIEPKIAALKVKLIQELEERRSNLILQHEEQLLRLKQEETAQILAQLDHEKELEIKKKLESGPDYSSLKMNSRAFESFTKLVNQYVKLIHGKDSKNLGNEAVPYMKEEEAIAKTYNKLKEIAGQLSKKDKENWLKKPRESNRTFEKISLWIGQDQAESLFNELENS